MEAQVKFVGDVGIFDTRVPPWFPPVVGEAMWKIAMEGEGKPELSSHLTFSVSFVAEDTYGSYWVVFRSYPSAKVSFVIRGSLVEREVVEVDPYSTEAKVYFCGFSVGRAVKEGGAVVSMSYPEAVEQVRGFLKQEISSSATLLSSV